MLTCLAKLREENVLRGIGRQSGAAAGDEIIGGVSIEATEEARCVPMEFR